MDKQKINQLALAIDSKNKLDEEFSAKKNILDEELSAKKAEFEEKNSELFERIEKVNSSIEEFKGEIRILALEEFEATNKKQLFGGIGIRVYKDFIYEENEAFAWAKEHDLCLSLDRSAFKKIAKTQEISFVKIDEKVTVTFPNKIRLEN